MNAPMPVNSDWPLERVQRLAALVGAGLGSPEIADKLGVTRNAVIGKCRRLKLQIKTRKSNGGVGKPRPSRTKAAIAARALPAGPVTLPPLTSDSIVLPVVMTPRKKPERPTPTITKRRCEWLDGHKPFKRCCDRAVFGYPYCEAHCRRAYINWRGAEPMEMAA
jgi:GcrA cell cycle regulator